MYNFRSLLCLLVVASFLLVNPVVAASESPQQILSKAITNLNKCATLSFSGSVTMKDMAKSIKYTKTSTSPARTTVIKSNFNGQFNSINPQSAKYNLFFDLAVDDSRGRIFKNLQVDLIGFGPKNYLRVNYAGDIKPLGEELSQFLNQWMMIDREAIRKDVLGVGYSESIKNSIENSEVNLKKLQDVLTILRKNNVVVLTKLKDEKVNGVNTTHFNYRVNKVGLRNFLLAFTKNIQGKKTLNTSEIKALDTWLKNGMLPMGGIWIGKKDYNIYRFTVVQSKKDQKKETNNVIDIKLDNCNQEIYITAPPSFWTVEDILQKLRFKDAMFGSSTSSARDAKRTSDLKQLQTAFELFYTDKNDYPRGTNILLGEDAGARCLDENGFQPIGCSHPYMSIIPKDPTNGWHYIYNYDTAKRSYTVTAQYEAKYLPAVLTPSGISK